MKLASWGILSNVSWMNFQLYINYDFIAIFLKQVVVLFLLNSTLMILICICELPAVIDAFTGAALFDIG